MCVSGTLKGENSLFNFFRARHVQWNMKYAPLNQIEPK